jgi:hypothetical protein
MDPVVHAHDMGVLVGVPHRQLFKYHGKIWLRDHQSLGDVPGAWNLPWRPTRRRNRSIAPPRRDCMASGTLFYPARPKGGGTCDQGNLQKGRQCPSGTEILPCLVDRGNLDGEASIGIGLEIETRTECSRLKNKRGASPTPFYLYLLAVLVSGETKADPHCEHDVKSSPM